MIEPRMMRRLRNHLLFEAGVRDVLALQWSFLCNASLFCNGSRVWCKEISDHDMAMRFSRDMHLIMLNQCIGSRMGVACGKSSLWWILARGVDLLNGVVPPLPTLSAYYSSPTIHQSLFHPLYKYSLYQKKKVSSLAPRERRPGASA